MDLQNSINEVYQLYRRKGNKMNEVQPIRSQKKILAIKNYIKGPDYNKIYRERDYLLFIMGINCALRI